MLCNFFNETGGGLATPPPNDHERSLWINLKEQEMDNKDG